MVKLFDRSVDLVDFGDGAPLYPICRSWIRNSASEHAIEQPAKREVYFPLFILLHMVLVVVFAKVQLANVLVDKFEQKNVPSWEALWVIGCSDYHRHQKSWVQTQFVRMIFLKAPAHPAGNGCAALLRAECEGGEEKEWHPISHTHCL